MLEKRKSMVSELVDAALDILDDGCPRDASMHQCCMGEDPERDCTSCWRCYLTWVISGHRNDPYRQDRIWFDGLVGG